MKFLPAFRWQIFCLCCNWITFEIYNFQLINIFTALHWTMTVDFCVCFIPFFLEIFFIPIYYNLKVSIKISFIFGLIQLVHKIIKKVSIIFSFQCFYLFLPFLFAFSFFNSLKYFLIAPWLSLLFFSLCFVPIIFFSESFIIILGIWLYLFSFLLLDNMPMKFLLSLSPYAEALIIIVFVTSLPSGILLLLS